MQRRDDSLASQSAKHGMSQSAKTIWTCAESASYLGYRCLCGLRICAHLALPQPRRAAQSTCSSNACEKELGRRFCHAPQTSHVGAMRSSGIYEAALSLRTDPGGQAQSQTHLALWAHVMSPITRSRARRRPLYVGLPGKLFHPSLRLTVVHEGGGQGIRFWPCAYMAIARGWRCTHT